MSAGARGTLATSPGVGDNFVSFEIFGKVQGVFFRKHTQQTASALGLRGHVQNTSNRRSGLRVESLSTPQTSLGGRLPDERQPKVAGALLSHAIAPFSAHLTARSTFAHRLAENPSHPFDQHFV